MWKNINAEEKSRAAFFPEDQCQVIIKNNKHTSFFTREKWICIVRNEVWRQVYVFDWKYLEDKFNLHNLNNIYLSLYSLTFELHLNLDWNAKHKIRRF